MQCNAVHLNLPQARRPKETLALQRACNCTHMKRSREIKNKTRKK